VDITADLLRAAHGDAWQVAGRVRGASGGGTAELPGVRLMTSGLPHPQWNNGDVHDAAVLDIGAVRAWYDARSVPWGLRVPAGEPFPHGRRLFGKRLMGVAADQLIAPAAVDGVDLRLAGPHDLEEVLDVDAVAFGSDPGTERPWLEGNLAAAEVDVVLAVDEGGRPVGTAYCLRSDLWAGPAAYVAGVGVLPSARGRGIASAMSAWLCQRAFRAGSAFAHLHPDDDRASSVYSRLGFVEVAGFDVYVGA
jgi:ribosomal protein S18 acetylase RimI-like enzyme